MHTHLFIVYDHFCGVLATKTIMSRKAKIFTIWSSMETLPPLLHIVIIK
jgi:hypothetical protein